MSGELLPCPFVECEGGLVAIEFDASRSKHGPTLQAWVECDCGARGPKTPAFVGDRERCRSRCIEEASNLWNTRTPTKAPDHG